MQLLAQTGETARSLRRPERPGEVGVAPDVLAHGPADVLRLDAAPVARVEEVRDRVAQLRLRLIWASVRPRVFT